MIIHPATLSISVRSLYFITFPPDELIIPQNGRKVNKNYVKYVRSTYCSAGEINLRGRRQLYADILRRADITADVSVAQATAQDCEGGRADSVELRFTDVEALWPRWRPRQSDELRLRHGHYDSGVMYIDRIALRAGYVHIAGGVVAGGRAPAGLAAWEAVTLKQVLAELCARHGLELSMYDVPDVSYPRLRQDGQCDLDWLAYRCMLECCALKVMGRRAVVYGVRQREASAPVRMLDLAGAVGYRYEDRAADRLASYAVMSGATYAICFDKSGDACRGGARAERALPRSRSARPRVRLRPAARAQQAGVYAGCDARAGRRSIRRRRDRARDRRPHDAGTWFIHAVRYDFLRGAAQLTLRRCLTW